MAGAEGRARGSGRGLGFPPVGDESYHAHALLTVYRDGEQVPVPADLGYDERGAHTSLHTHTPDGVLHMEADDPYPYTLGHVMTTWGVALDQNTLGGHTDGTETVHVFVNGKPATPDVVLGHGDNVVVAYGTEDSYPKLPPADALEAACQAADGPARHRAAEQPPGGGTRGLTVDGYLLVLALAALPAAGNFAGGLLAEAFDVPRRVLSLALHLAAGIIS